jgi:hypothetical protein
MTRTATRHPSPLLAGGMAFTLSILSSAICLAATLQMEDRQQHASCAMGHESGTPETTQLNCCIAQSPQFAGVAPDTAALLVASVAVVSPVDATPESFVMALPALPAFDPDVSKPSRTPTYLLVSVFRL